MRDIMNNMRVAARSGTRAVVAAIALAAVSAAAQTREHVVALVAPLTGPAAVYGSELSAGVQAYLAQLNKQGGIKGVPPRLLVHDDKYQASLTTDLVKAAIEKDHPLAFI